MSSMINKLLSIPMAEPETKQVRLPRLDLVVTLRELDYSALMDCRRSEEATLQYLLKSITEPNLKDPAWYLEALGCPTPIEAMKKLFRAGEVERLCRMADQLNGYEAGSVVAVERSDEELEGAALTAALEELEKN